MLVKFVFLPDVLYCRPLTTVKQNCWAAVEGYELSVFCVVNQVFLEVLLIF